jgi:hypothetical protein
VSPPPPPCALPSPNPNPRHSFALQYNGKRNLYNVFLERGVQVVRPQGRLGFIVQDAFSLNDNSTGVRTMVARTCHLDFMLEVPVRNLMFPDVHKGALVIVLTVGRPGGAVDAGAGAGA